MKAGASKRAREEEEESDESDDGDEVYKPKRALPKGYNGLTDAFRLEFTCEKNCGMGPDENRIDAFVTKWEGTLTYVREDSQYTPDEPEREIAGSIKCWKIHSHNIVNFTTDGDDNMGDFLDPLDQELHEFGVFLDTMKHDWNMWEETGGAVLYVEEVRVQEAFKGLGLGLFMVDMADHTLNDHMSLLVLMPYPFQYVGKRGECDETAFESDRMKLFKYFQKLGLRRVEGPEDARNMRPRGCLQQSLLFPAQPLQHSNYAIRWNGSIHPRADTVCKHLYP